MSMRLAVPCLALSLFSCATPSSTGGSTGASGPAAPVREKMSVVNNSPFDLAACPGHPLSLDPLSEEVVMGALLTRGPAFQECFLDTKSAQGSPADVAVKATVSPEGVSVAVSGTGVSDAGKACLEAAVKAVDFPKLPAGAAPVSGQVPVALAVKPVVFGMNVASDVAGTIRLALPSMCGCFKDLGDAPPPQPVAKLKLTATTPPEVLFDGVGATPGLGTCLVEKVKALALPKSDVEMALPLILVNGWAASASPDVSAALQFQQLEAMRSRRTAEVLITAGRRGTAALRYDEVVKKYKAKPTPSLIGELKTKCADVLSGDDANLAALKALMDVYQAEAKLVQAEKAKDPAWANVEASLSKQLTQTSGEVVRVEQQKVADAAACPKSK
ncbi:MAG: hypothetical protein AB1938_07685 [Myxococcota bacterium]